MRRFPAQVTVDVSEAQRLSDPLGNSRAAIESLNTRYSVFTRRSAQIP